MLLLINIHYFVPVAITIVIIVPFSINGLKSSLLRKCVCFNFLPKSHISKFCREKNPCSNCNLRYRIFFLINLKNKIAKKAEDTESVTIQTTTLNCATSSEINENVFLQTAVAYLINKSQEEKIKIIWEIKIKNYPKGHLLIS